VRDSTNRNGVHDDAAAAGEQPAIALFVAASRISARCAADVYAGRGEPIPADLQELAG